MSSCITELPVVAAGCKRAASRRPQECVTREAQVEIVQQEEVLLGADPVPPPGTD